MAPLSTTSQWHSSPKNGIDGLQLIEDITMPELKDTEVLMAVRAVTLNYRDVAMLTGEYPFFLNREAFVPCSDGSGTVVAVGSKVSQFKAGDKVCTIFNQDHQSGFVTNAIRGKTLGGWVDGPLREYAVYPEKGLVKSPETLNFREAAALPCAAVTAWNALTGLSGRRVQKGDYVLVQGTGGVSMCAAQFAIALGAIVIGTTSKDEKADFLKSLGVMHVINYMSNPDWGEAAKKLTPGAEGVHHVVEVGGELTMAQSLKAIRCEGVISIIGFLGGKDQKRHASFSDCLQSLSIARGVNAGSREQFMEMNQVIDQFEIKPILDKTIFRYENAKDAFEYMKEGRHFGKVVIDVGSD